MVFFGKNTDNDLEMRITGNDIQHLYHLLLSAQLVERRVFNPLKRYLEDTFPGEERRAANE